MGLLGIKWSNETRTLGELNEYEYNPRQLTEKQAKDLRTSLEKFGLVSPLIVNVDNTLIGGHQRKKILDLLSYLPPEYEIDVRVPERKLSDEEVAELNVRLNKNQGQWDFEALGNYFDTDSLLEWGFEDYEMGIPEWGEGGEDEDTEDTYTSKIEGIQYEPTGESVDLSDLYDDSRTHELIEEIQSAEIPDDIKEFLSLAATRHIVYDFRNIAEYFAQADADIQALMERSGLVIVDYEKAIEYGFVQLSKDIEDMRESEYGE